MKSLFEEIMSFLKYTKETLDQDKYLSPQNLILDMPTKEGEDLSLMFLNFYQKHSKKVSPLFKKNVSLKEIYALFESKESDVQKLYQVMNQSLQVFGWPHGAIKDILNEESNEFVKSRIFDLISLCEEDEAEALWKQKDWHFPDYLSAVAKSRSGLNGNFPALTTNVIKKFLKASYKEPSGQMIEVLKNPRITRNLLVSQIEHEGLLFNSPVLSTVTGQAMYLALEKTNDLDLKKKITKVIKVKKEKLSVQSIDVINKLCQGKEELSANELLYLYNAVKDGALSFDNFSFMVMFFRRVNYANSAILNRVIHTLRTNQRHGWLAIALRYHKQLSKANMKATMRILREKKKEESLEDSEEHVYGLLKIKAQKDGLPLHGIWG